MKKIFLITLLIISIFILNKNTEAYGECTQYGLMSIYSSYTDKCSCMSGYSFGKNYIGQTSCISDDQLCQDQYGYNATSDYLSGNCKCRYGYGFAKDYSGKTTCTSLSTICTDKLGYNSRYDSLSETCKCNSGYTIGDSGTCVEKQNNVYFRVKELNTSDRKAIIKSNYDSNYYEISYGSGCYSFSFERYVDKDIVVNLGTDYDLDTWDKIVLQDDNETCDITRKEKVGYDFTLTPQDTSYSTTYTLPSAQNTSKKYLKNLQVGSSGVDVTRLQIRLEISPISGYFGQTTKKAVIKYQKENNISPATGFVGLSTRNLLNK